MREDLAAATSPFPMLHDQKFDNRQLVGSATSGRGRHEHDRTGSPDRRVSQSPSPIGGGCRGVWSTPTGLDQGEREVPRGLIGGVPICREQVSGDNVEVAPAPEGVVWEGLWLGRAVASGWASLIEESSGARQEWHGGIRKVRRCPHILRTLLTAHPFPASRSLRRKRKRHRLPEGGP